MMTQMNIRIDDGVKSRGDEVFARYGFTPSQAVRALWEHASKEGDVPRFMRSSVDESAVAEAERQRKLALANEGSRIWEHFFVGQGHPVSALPKITDQDLREEVYFGKPARELDDTDLRLAHFDDLRSEAYREKMSEQGQE